MDQMLKRSVRCWSVAIACALPGLAMKTVMAAELREWKDSTGTFSVEAEFVKSEGDKVHLRRADGGSADQEFIRSLGSSNGPKTATRSQLSGKPTELKNDDGTAAGKKSLPRGIASSFSVDQEGTYITAVRIHGARYGYARPPKEDFVISLCDSDFKPIAEFDYPYSKFQRGAQKWVTLNVRPTEVPQNFIICLNFNAEQTKGVYVSHDGEGESPVGLPNKPAGRFNGGDWMVRVKVDRLKSGG